MKDLTFFLIKCKNRKVHTEEFFSFVEDMLRNLENEQIEEYEKNKYLIGMKELFRGCIVKEWKGVDFSTIKHREVNKTVIIKCVECYVKYGNIEMNAHMMKISNERE